MPRYEGHGYGYKSVVRFCEAVLKINREAADNAGKIEYVTIYSFSTENWQRPETEVSSIISLANNIDPMDVHKNGIKLLHVGREDRLETAMHKRLKEAVELTKDNDKLTLCIAFDYGGRDEILNVTRQIMDSDIAPADLTEQHFSKFLYTADQPYPDLLIRTGGEYRISNFLLWQVAYAELYFTPILWPDLTAELVEDAVEEYTRRKRRFGK